MSVELKFPITKSQHEVILRANSEVDKAQMALQFAEKARDAALSAILASDEALFKKKIGIKSFNENFIAYTLDESPVPVTPDIKKVD